MIFFRPDDSTAGIGERNSSPTQLRAVSPMTQAGDDLQAEGVELNDSSTISNESSDCDSSSRDESDASFSHDGTPTPTAAWTAARQLGAHMSGSGDDEEIHEGRTRAQTSALNHEAAAGLISARYDRPGGVFLALLPAQEAGGEPTKLTDCLVKEVEPEPTSYSAASSSRHSGVWTEAMQAEFDGLDAAGTFTEISEIPEGSNIVGSKWLLKWKGDEHGMRTSSRRLLAQRVLRNTAILF